MPAKINCSFLGLNLKNPLVLASGVLGTSATLLERVTAKSCSLEPREGHPNPVSVAWKHGMINAIGLTNPGVEEECKVLAESSVILKKKGVLLFASIFGGKIEDYDKVATRISEAEPDLIEINISCPNVADEFGTPFAADEKSTAAVTRAVRKATQLKIAVKLTPNTPAIGRIARAAVEEGADAITAINTVPGVVIDAYARRPVLFNRIGGISGGAIKPVALRCVMEIARAVNVPIIGTGGVETGLDAVEMIMAGATLVGIGAAVATRGVDVFRQVNEEIIQFMESENINSLEEIRGAALK
jgi:dihydroorotate dehydrogenase (NAD+) catalytic subunit